MSKRLKENKLMIMAVGYTYFGKGDTLNEAVMNVAKLMGAESSKGKSHEILLYVCSEQTAIGHDGLLRYPADGPKPFYIGMVMYRIGRPGNTPGDHK